MNRLKVWHGLVVLGIVATVAAISTLRTTIEMHPLAANLNPGWQIFRPPHDVEALVEQGELMWAGGRDGVFALARDTGALVEVSLPEPPFTYVQALLVDDAGALWVGHFNGLARYHEGVWQTYTVIDGLPDNRVNALLQDQQGRLWVGTWGGAAVFEGNAWHTLTTDDGLLVDMVNVLLQDEDGGLWFGSYVAPHGGISYWRDGVWQYFTTADGLAHNNITALVQDASGAVWAGTGLYNRGGACRFEQNGVSWELTQVLMQSDGLAGAKVRSIFQDRDGVLWFGSEYDGVVRFDGINWHVFTTNHGLASPEIKVLVQDEAGALWLGTLDGITRISREALAAMSSVTP